MFKQLHDHLLAIGFRSSKTDVSLFIYLMNGDFIYLLIYVDGILIIGNNLILLNSVIPKFAITFKIGDLGGLNYFLGVEILHGDVSLTLSYKRNMVDILKQDRMTDYNLVATPISTAKFVTSTGCLALCFMIQLFIVNW